MDAEPDKLSWPLWPLLLLPLLRPMQRAALPLYFLEDHLQQASQPQRAQVEQLLAQAPVLWPQQEQPYLLERSPRARLRAQLSQALRAR